MTIINPVKEALSDLHRRHRAGGKRWDTRFCCKCSLDKPTKGGAFPDRKKSKEKYSTVTSMMRFVCAECLANKYQPKPDQQETE